MYDTIQLGAKNQNDVIRYTMPKNSLQEIPCKVPVYNNNADGHVLLLWLLYIRSVECNARLYCKGVYETKWKINKKKEEKRLNELKHCHIPTRLSRLHLI